MLRCLVLMLLLAMPIGAEPVDLLRSLGAKQELVEVGRLDLDFRTFRPRGLARAGDRWFLSSVEVTDEARGRGRGHLFVADREGRLIRDVVLGRGAAFHAGGIGCDGTQVWVPVAEAGPGGRTLVYSVDLRTLEPTLRFQVRDHLSALAVDGDRRILYALDHGARGLYTMTQGGRIVERAHNPNRFFEYREIKRLPSGELLGSGVATQLVSLGARAHEVPVGGLSIFSPSGRFSLILPVTKITERHRPICENSAEVEIDSDSVRLHFAPDEDRTTIYSFAPAPARR